MLAGTLVPVTATAETLRIATYNTELGRAGPGLLLRDLEEGDPQAKAVARIVAHARPDVVVLQGIDWDAGGATLSALSDRIAEAGWPMPHGMAPRPNAGIASGRDLDGDGRPGGPGDALGWGRFAGSGGLALLSRHPIDAGRLRDHTSFRWADVPSADPAPSDAGLPVASVGIWVATILAPGGPVDILALHATPPVFDGPEDRNGRRNRDELALVHMLIEAGGPDGPEPPFVVAGDLNLDPQDGEGRHDALHRLVASRRIVDPEPIHDAAAPETGGHLGDPRQDTVAWDGPGRLRVDYVLPSSDWRIGSAGVVWPTPGDDLAEIAETASRHRLVWVDVVR